MKNEIKKIEIINIIIGLSATLICLLVYKEARIPLSVALGSVIGGANFLALTVIFSKMVNDGAGGKALFGMLAAFKFVMLVVILWAAIRWLPISGIWLLAGLTTIIVSILINYVVLAKAGN